MCMVFKCLFLKFRFFFLIFLDYYTELFLSECLWNEQHHLPTSQSEHKEICLYLNLNFSIRGKKLITIISFLEETQYLHFPLQLKNDWIQMACEAQLQPVK